MQISSSAFGNNSLMPSKFSCDGEGISPPLKIDGVPDETQSLALIMDDPDIPETVKSSKGIEVFDHWLVFDISTKNLISGSLDIKEGGADIDGVNGTNSAGSVGYVGPCPPDGEHRYFFKVYALKSFLDLPEGASRMQIEKGMDGLVLDKAELFGLYKKI